MFRRFEWSNGIATIIDAISRLWVFLFPTGVAGVSAWAASAVSVWDAYRPFSWIAAGLVGGLIAVLAYALFGYGRTRVQIAKFRERLAAADFVNPLDATFEKRRIRITDVQPPLGGLVDGKTFVNCDLVGPANVIVHNCTFRNAGGSDVDAIIVTTGIPKNGIIFTNCTFTNCRFFLMTFLVPDSLFWAFSTHQFTGLNWLTSIPAMPSATVPVTQPQQPQAP